MNIMITGVSGGYGSYAVEYLKEFAPDDEIYVLVRTQQKAEEFKQMGLNTRIGDYSDADSMINALKDIDRLLFVSVSIPDIQKNVVEACKICNVKYVAYTSLYDLEYEKFSLEINHRNTEELIKESGIKHAFLRDNWYLDMMAPYFTACEKIGEFIYYSDNDNAKIAWALKKEYAEAGARVIADGNQEGVINLAGNPVSYKELGEALKETSDSIENLRLVSRDEFIKLLSGAGVSEMAIGITCNYQDYAITGNNGESEANCESFENTLTHKLTPLPEAIRFVVDGGFYSDM
jgi:NAD(P)H dehydrogenase (quinone)